MKKQLYYCNFCKEEINLGGTDGKRYGYGVNWTWDNMLEAKRLNDVEHHICSNCLVAIAQLESMISDDRGARDD